MTDVDALCQQKSIGDAAADNQLVDDARQIVQHLELTGDFGATDNGQHRTLGAGQRPLQRVKFPGQQRAGAGRPGEFSDTMGAGLCAMSSTERIHHKDITELCVRPGQLRVIRLFTRIDAHVLQHNQAL